MIFWDSSISFIHVLTTKIDHRTNIVHLKKRKSNSISYHNLWSYHFYFQFSLELVSNELQLTKIYVCCITITCLNFGTFLSQFFCMPTRNLDNDKIKRYHYFWDLGVKFLVYEIWFTCKLIGYVALTHH